MRHVAHLTSGMRRREGFISTRAGNNRILNDQTCYDFSQALNLGWQAAPAESASLGSMEKARPIPEKRSQRVPAALSLALVLGAGAYVALSRHFSALGLVLFFVSASVLLFLCWKPNKKAAAATGIIAVGAVVYALPLGVVVSSATFGAGLMAIGVVIAALHL